MKLSLLLIVLGIALFLTLIVFNQRLILYPVRHVNNNAHPSSEIRRILYREVEDFRVEAWLLWPESPPRGLIVHAHGNGEAVEILETSFAEYSSKDHYAVLMVEYRGYARSGGSPSKDAIVDDFIYFLERVLTEHPELGQHIVYHGRSLGGGVVAELGKRKAPDALILESTFTSVADMARQLLWVPAFLIWDNYDTIGFLRSYEGPVLLIHTPGDEVIPYSHAQKNLEAAKNASLLTLEGRHNDMTALNWTHYRAAITSFLDETSQALR
jgi:fermentation-respiration switch protein FrsA (DUF1100 family)